MKVTCKINNLNNFTDEKLLMRLKKYEPDSDGEVDLRIGQEYTVYGIIFWAGTICYYLCKEEIFLKQA